MKNLLVSLLIIATFTSCEDVIDLELNTAEPRLVIEAFINWQKGTNGNNQKIKLSLTTPFFDTNTQVATGADVFITNSNGDIFIFDEVGNTGVYVADNFIPVFDETYQLTIAYNDEVYTATETLKSVVSIDFIEQNNNGGFSGDETELKAFYTDPADEINFYFFEFISDIPVIPSLEVYEDRFINGNQSFGFYTEEDLATGDQVVIRNYGISQRFYNFMFILLQQISEDGGGPFETQPATVRGNCVNITNPDNFPLGYFRLSEFDEVTYVVQ